MKILFETSFARDLKRIRDKRLQQLIGETIDEVKAADDLQGSITLNRGEVVIASFLSYGSLYVEQIIGIGPFSG